MTRDELIDNAGGSSLKASGAQTAGVEDVFLIAARAWYGHATENLLSDFLRTRFGPCVEALEMYAHGVLGESMASKALARLRAEQENDL